MSTMASTRPGTPYPYAYPSPPPLFHRTSSTPLHFHIPTLPSRTPPSLLHRTPSTNSNPSSPKHFSASPTMPSLSERRSSSSSSSCSSSSPTTPKLLPIPDNVQVQDLNDLPPSFYSGEPIKSKLFSGRPPLYRGLAVPNPPKLEAPRRPKMVRRDTPRPKTEGILMGMQTIRQ